MNSESAAKEPTVIGIGASAGGLAALKTFFASVPADSGLAYVVVMHLSPDHKSHLAELLQPHVAVPVQQVSETVPLEPNRVYVIPPNANLNAIDTHLRLSKLEERRQERAPIDHFFRTLARSHDGRSVAVVLTGTGSDGTLGLKDVKASGGLVIVQDPNEAEYDGVPQSAIATGLADFVLPIAEIPQTILRFDSTEPKIPVVDDGESVPQDERILLRNILAVLRTRTDRDFSRYKPSTILRRIARRMQLNHLEETSAYLELLRDRVEEARALADDLLITVTRFFRDPEVFEKLENEVVPQLFERKTGSGSIRAWSVGCATGEEAYSLAVILSEAAQKVKNPPPIQVFASDLHSRSLAVAREGLYPGDVETDVSAERLRQFFQRENGGYRIRKEIRDLVVFAPHNILADPPFSRMDLISCRNLLIYLERDVQNEVVEIFHYALNSDGVMLLGPAESVEMADLFRPLDKKLCLFAKRNTAVREPRLPVFPLTHGRLGSEASTGLPMHSAVISSGNLHQRMLEQYAPPSVLVSPDNRLLHLSQHAGRYLVLPGGEPTASVLKLVREELQLELQAAIYEAREKREPVDSRPIPVRFNGHPRPVVMHVRPALEQEGEGYILVIFEERAPQDSQASFDEQRLAAGRIEELEGQIDRERRRTQTIIEDYESSREEMSASSEELQSTNEELRSTMEELETSKEELQSINEELQTVNQQNRHKVEELAQLSSDLQNLLVATDIATLFLDRHLRILRFTPRLSDIFNIRVTDRGRPMSDLTHRLGYTELEKDAQSVLSRLVPVEREIQDQSGRWYLSRVLPYRDTDDRIDGVVITFIDVDARKKAEATVRAAMDRLSRMINVDVVGVLIFDTSGVLVDSNETFRQMSGYSKDDIASGIIHWRTLTPPEYVQASEEQMKKLAATGRIGPYEKQYVRKDGSQSWMLFAGASLGDGTVIEYCIDVSDRKQAERQVAEARDYAESIIQTLHEPLLVLTSDLRVNSANPAFYRHFKVEPADTLGKRIYDLGNRQWDIPALRTLLQDVLPNNSVFERFEVEYSFEKLGRRTMLLNGRRLESSQLILLGVDDITERKQQDDQLRRSLEEKNTLVREIHHRVKNNLQVVVSLLSLQASHTHDPQVNAAFTDAESRVRAIANIHESLYASDSLSETEFALYLGNLARQLVALHADNGPAVALDLQAIDMALSVELAILLGLIANELIVNSLKHGLRGTDRRLSVQLSYVAGSFRPERGETIDDGWAELRVSDNGPGFPAGFDPSKMDSFGLRLINLLVVQLKGRIEIGAGPGATVSVKFPVDNSLAMGQSSGG